MGARLLRRWVQYPLLNAARIAERQDAVEEFRNRGIDRAATQDALGPVQDLERLNSRISLGVATPRDLVTLRPFPGGAAGVRLRLGTLTSKKLGQVFERLDPLEDVCEVLRSSLVEEPPITVREGGVFKEGFREDLDELREISRGGKRWIAALESRERERTGIASLKVRFNKVFGYYIEITKANLAGVPDDYERKQTLVNAERFTMPVLKEYETKVMGAEERANELEYELFLELRNRLAVESLRIRNTAEALAELDVLACLAEVAARNEYAAPENGPRQGTRDY